MAIIERQTRKGAVVWDVVVAQGRKRVWQRVKTTRRDAERLETKLKASRDAGANISFEKITLGAWLERWLRDYASGLQQSTFETYRTNLRTHVVPALGDRRLKDLRPADVQALYGRIMARRSRKTCLNVHRVLKEALQHAVRLEVVGRNVCDAVMPPRAPSHKVVPPSLQEIDRIFELADATAYGPVVRLCVLTALRQGELLQLRWDDVDLAAGMLYIRTAKHDSAGAVTLSQEAVDLLIAHNVDQSRQFTNFGPAYKRDWVFTNAIGKQMDAGGLKRAWLKRVQPHLERHVRFHDLRHAHASLLIAAGVHPKVIQERLRHRHISTTMDIYGHLMPGMQREAAQRIDEALSAPRGE
jgi:integrase